MSVTDSNPPKPRLLVVSSVLPFPGTAGQQQRVAYTLKALREYFHVTFLTAADGSIRSRLLEHVDDAILLPPKYSKNIFTRIFHRTAALIYTGFTGLKLSNYITGKLEFSPRRISSLLNERSFDIALFEYWHAVESVPVFRQKNIPCVLDMHNILWQSYKRHPPAKTFMLRGWSDWAISQYKKREEEAWKKFDGLIAINRAEMEYTAQRISDKTKIFYAPMGVDISSWAYSWRPAHPPRLAYYGGLGSRHNQLDAIFCYEQIMPIIWREHPNAELWLVGSNPPDLLKKIEAADPRVKVTDYIEQVQNALARMSVVLCPWSGTYGFRSR
ncbi:MAG: glycosyltransferase family 4 protein, partial [Anaerolineales bacterium]|nr:glycosyltransferase family 4 protein [Anaerolineales bacterium]